MHTDNDAVKARAEYIAHRFPHLASDATALATEWAEREADETFDGSDARSPHELLRWATQSIGAVKRWINEGDSEWAVHLADRAILELIRAAHAVRV